jgi:hypothetical protein
MTIPKNYSNKAFVLIWFAIGLACLFATVQQLNSDINYFNHFDPSVLIPATFSMLTALTGVAFIKAWPFSTILNRISGIIIALYSLAVITMGVEYVRGPLIAGSFGLAGIAFGIWSIIIKRGKA